MSVLLLMGLGWLAAALAGGLLIGGSIRTAEAEARRTPPRVPSAFRTPSAPHIGPASRVLVGAGAAPSPRRAPETGAE